MLAPATKLLVCDRRLFAEDQPRFFVGTVDAFEGGIAKVSGITWMRDPSRGFPSRGDGRTKLLPGGPRSAGRTY